MVGLLFERTHPFGFHRLGIWIYIADGGNELNEVLIWIGSVTIVPDSSLI